MANKTIAQMVELKYDPAKCIAQSLAGQKLDNRRVYSPTSLRKQTWWQPLNAPLGLPQGSPSSGLYNKQKEVLVIEDEVYLCDLIVDVLESDGHRARKASNGLDAIRLMEEYKPQLILLDLMMPIMDGREFLSQVKKHEEWIDIPVIIITAVYDIRDTVQETGALAVITKPFDIDQLSELVNLYAK